jgi:GT2 family glycosyltransferase
VLNQTIPCRIFSINNGSVDNIPNVLAGLGNEHIVVNAYPQLGVAGAWNYGLSYLFSAKNGHRVSQALVINQDIILRPDTYEILNNEPGDFVTAVSTGRMDKLFGDVQQPIGGRRPHPDFSCFRITRRCYETVGLFDEDFYPAYFEDNDMHIRLSEAGIEAYCIDLPFYHDGGSTVRRAREQGLAEPYDVAFRANQERFFKKWGVLPGTKEYEELCQVRK